MSTPSPGARDEGRLRDAAPLASPASGRGALQPSPIPATLNDRNNQAAIEGNARLTKRPDTPEQREARLQKALALKAEAQALALADGGTMTKSHQRYIQKKADKIMSE